MVVEKKKKLKEEVKSDKEEILKKLREKLLLYGEVLKYLSSLLIAIKALNFLRILILS
jgi:hypothetical protein